MTNLKEGTDAVDNDFKQSSWPHTSSKTANDSSNPKEKRNSKEDTNDNGRGRDNKQVQERITEKDKMDNEHEVSTAGSEIAHRSQGVPKLRNPRNC